MILLLLLILLACLFGIFIVTYKKCHNYCLECDTGYIFRSGDNCIVYSDYYYITRHN